MEPKLDSLEKNVQAAESKHEKVAALNALLEEYPLLFGYWLKLIEISEDPQREWTRALEQCPVLDLWVPYLNSPFGASQESARLATDKLGYHFQASPLWDALLQRSDSDASVIREVIKIPLYAYAQYFQLAYEQNVEPSETLEKMASEIAAEVTQRYEFEAKIKRPYFHPYELEEAELEAWRQYVNFTEQSQKASLQETKQLYEKCLVSTALYQEFWLRYIQWLSRHDLLSEDVCRRALRYHDHKGFRLIYSRTLESNGQISQARDELLHVGDLKQLVAFDRRHNFEPESRTDVYNLEYASQTGDLSRLTPEQIRESPELFNSPEVDPKSLLHAWKHNQCPDARKYAERLKETGNLREFFIVDATLSYS